MGLPKKIKKDLSLIPKKTLLPRRHEIADMISEDGTYLPKSTCRVQRSTCHVANQEE